MKHRAFFATFHKKAHFLSLVLLVMAKHFLQLRFFKLQKLIKRGIALFSILLPYAGLALFTFATVVIVLPQTGLYHAHATTKPVTEAIINSQELEAASISASLAITPTASISPLPTDVVSPASPSSTPLSSIPAATVSATPSSEQTPATPSADFCLNIPILMYHHIQPLSVAGQRGQDSLTVDTAVFDQQMQYLVTHGYQTISAEDLVLALHNHTYLPPTDVILTIDDGYLDNYTDAFPIAKKYHVILNIMVATGLLGTHPQGTDNYYFSWPQLKEMVDSGWVNAYDHTWSHYPLGEGTIDKNQFEIMTPKQQLEQNLGKTVDLLAYPYGSGQDMPWVGDALRQDGFIGAFSTIGGTTQCESFIMSLHRDHVGDAYFPGFGIN